MKEVDVHQKYDFGKNCVCVGRVSTSVQSKTAQIEDLTKFATSYGYKKVQTFFTTESGFLEIDDKQGWNKVTEFFEANKDFRVLICPEISRLSRKEAILFKIKDYLIENKIQLIIKDIHFQLFDEWGEIPKGNDIVFALYASLADSEMRQKKERFRRGLEDNRRLGYSIGGKELFGYHRYYETKDGKKRSKYEINEEEAEQIRTIYKWYAFGIDGDISKTSVLEITKKCIEEGFDHYLHSKRNVNKCLKEKAYLGEKETHNRVHNADHWNYKNYDKPKYIEGKSYLCTYPAIFAGEDAALFDKVQKRLIENNSRLSKGSTVPVDKSTKHITILSKLVKCPNCGKYLVAEYRVRKDKRRPELSEKCYFTYRCHNSRGVIKHCGFNHIISMPLLDSVVWSYCKTAALSIITSEKKKDRNEQLEEVDKKIKNLQSAIDGFNIEGKRKAEESILRSKMARLKSPEAIEAAINAYQENVDRLDDELCEYEARILELEKEKGDIMQSSSLIDNVSKRDNISSNKKLLYQYIHKLVDSVDIVYTDHYYTVLKIYLKHHIPFYRSDSYICIKKKTTRNIVALIVRPVDSDLEALAIADMEKKGADYMKKFRYALLDELPSKNNLYWDNENNMFEIEDVKFSVERLFDYYNCPSGDKRKPVIEQMLDINLSVLPIRIKKLYVERLTCYNEDCGDRKR